ncbi:hypothetical protein DENSPDRAFT_831165 [Dentipellis sp. KUC8613]|nr:hypothetical protein DENSPDRAFT_831165 [Dentipellis sp. KUC8613]
MSYSAASASSSYTLFPTAPSAPHAFGLFGQSPRDNYTLYEDLYTAIRPSTKQASERQRKVSGSSMKSSLKKILGGF